MPSCRSPTSLSESGFCWLSFRSAANPSPPGALSLPRLLRSNVAPSGDAMNPIGWLQPSLRAPWNARANGRGRLCSSSSSDDGGGVLSLRECSLKIPRSRRRRTGRLGRSAALHARGRASVSALGYMLVAFVYFKRLETGFADVS